jgi:predicted metal-dependent hydrolase
MNMKEKILRDDQIGEVVLRKSTRSRRLSVRVHPVRGVSVSIPWFMSELDGARFFRSKRDWVLRAIDRQRQKAVVAEETGRAISGLGNGSVIHTLLSEVTFREDTKSWVEVIPIEDVRPTRRTYLNLARPLFRKIVHFTPDTDLRKTLVELLRGEAKILLPTKLRYLAERYGFTYGRVTIKHNSSNWGSCSSKGNINLNLNLVRLPEPLCDYVLLHELCHLHNPNHSARFHRELEKRVMDNLERLSRLGDPSSDQLFADFRSCGGSFRIDEYLSRQIARYRIF